MKRILPIFIILFTMLIAKAQVATESFESYKLIENRTLRIYTPEDYSPDKIYPLIVVLDAEYLFDIVMANSKFYSYWNEMPQAIVVGIEQNYNNIRTEDCDFSDSNSFPHNKGSQFFEFIGMELLPYLSNKYNLAPFKMIVGHSLTANFANYYLFKDNTLFNAYLILSPTLAPEMEYHIPKRLDVFKDKKFYYLATGEFDNKASVKRIQVLDSNLKGLQNEMIDYYFDNFENAGHTTLAAYAIPKAFDKMFKIFKPITPEEYKEKLLTIDMPVFNYLNDKYTSIETFFGIKQKVYLNDIMAIYAAAKKREDLESLKQLAGLCKKEYPETMMGFFFEAEYFEQKGEPKKALRTYEKAFGMNEIDFITKDLALERIDALKADFGF